MKKKKLLFILLSLSTMFLCSACTQKDTSAKPKKTDYQKIYIDYLSTNVLPSEGFARLNKISSDIYSDSGSYTANPKITGNTRLMNAGLIGCSFTDLNKDKIPEMITLYADTKTNDQNNEIGLLDFDVYTILENNVTKVELEEDVPATEFFYNTTCGNLHVFTQSNDGIISFNILKAFNHFVGDTQYDIRLLSFIMEDGKLKCRYYTDNTLYDKAQYDEMVSKISKECSELTLGNWFKEGFDNQSVNTESIPYDFNLDEKDKNITDVLRIKENINDFNLQEYQYFDYTDIRSKIPIGDSAEKIIKLYESKIGIPDLKNISIEWPDAGTMYVNMKDSDMGLVSVLEDDINNDGSSELLVFYLEQKCNPYEKDVMQQNLCIDLFTYKDDNFYFVDTIDVLQPVLPWSSKFCASDKLYAGICKSEGKTYLYLERSSSNEGPSQNAIYIYDLTSPDNIRSSSYYYIVDGGRNSDALMVPAHINGGSSGEHQFIIKLTQDENTLYFESSLNEDFQTDAIYTSIDTAMSAVRSELEDLGISDKNMNDIFSWKYDRDSGKPEFCDKTGIHPDLSEDLKIQRFSFFNY